ncbi:hypothetical protein CEXT_204711 [Caerostris extrusa]|uniref:Uncharacterized protein n=1 Tax=Caerostris extrusa TaxID=172846 RepID=A0AAV4MTC4_CAEEX|nr:hypothetical protein CEXT_204711 [Caerostris extrusa]
MISVLIICSKGRKTGKYSWGEKTKAGTNRENESLWREIHHYGWQVEEKSSVVLWNSSDHGLSFFSFGFDRMERCLFKRTSFVVWFRLCSSKVGFKIVKPFNGYELQVTD